LSYLESHHSELLASFEPYYLMVDLLKIPDFATVTKEALATDVLTLHPLVSVNPFNNHKTLFIGTVPCYPTVDEKGTPVNLEASGEDVFNIAVEKVGFYRHQWEEGDLVIWDNVQVMHKSQGISRGPRLLHRTQGRFHDNASSVQHLNGRPVAAAYEDQKATQA
jgi:alpha-ketoglutarate-dependent taurine dioxygenase